MGDQVAPTRLRERTQKIDYALYIDEFKRFFEYFTEGTMHDEDDDPYNIKKIKYAPQIEKIRERKQILLEVELDDIESFFRDDRPELVSLIEKNTMRYIEIASIAVDELNKPFEEAPIANHPSDIVDVLMLHRRQRESKQLAESNVIENIPPPVSDQNANDQNAAAGAAAKPKDKPPPALGSTSLPTELMRRFELVFVPRANTIPINLRKIRADHIGNLVTFRGIITRVSGVKPLLTIATYTCDMCGHENYQEIKSKTFMPLTQCASKECEVSKGKLFLQTRGSKFLKFQEIRIQEPPDQVPMGTIPRTITVLASGELCRRCSPGDMATIAGVFLPTPFTGWQALRAGLIADTYIQAQVIIQEKKTYDDLIVGPEMQTRADELIERGNVYESLANSIAPEIYGHSDVKKALLLMMVGGSTRTLSDGMRIRGDINICLMGDPGVAKSQLLKHIASVAPRGVYTSGKGASGVGLTAAVIKDQYTNEFVLEGGSLVLADMGICCIDEFDKMDETDRTAIHEVMEQQTISIAKAGINTTLNARTAILAAANPAYGRYNTKRTPAENINLPAALLSRFDLLFLILDKPNEEEDMKLAEHVTYVHRHNKHPKQDFEVLDAEFIRCYISQARKLNPYITEELSENIVAAYVNMRQEEKGEEGVKGYVTARALLSVLRFSQALARLSMRDVVLQADIDEAIRLLEQSKASLYDDSGKSAVDIISRIYQILLTMKGDENSVNYEEARRRVLAQGFVQNQFLETLRQYEELSLLMVSANNDVIHFIG